MGKTIYLDPDEEITSVVDRLAQAKSYRVNLVIPQNAQIWQSSVNLKLLKREADYYDKKVLLVVADDRAAELAERLGFETKKEVDFIPEQKQEQEQELESEIEIKAEARDELSEKRDLPEEPLIKDKEEILAEEEPIFDEPAISDQSSLRRMFDEPSSEKTEEEIVDELWAERARPLKTRRGKTEEEQSVVRQPSIRQQAEYEPLIKIKGPEQAIPALPIVLAGSRLPKKPKKRLDAAASVATGAGNRINFLNQELLKLFSFKKKKPSWRRKPIFPKRLEKTEAIKELRWSGFFAVFVGLAIAVAFSVVYLVLPSAEIVIEPVSETVNFDILAVGSEDIPEADKNLNKIPLQRIRVTETKNGEFSASGEKEVNAKARGAIIIYNEYSSESQTLVATTRFESSEGKIYRIEKNLLVPGAKIQEGKIIASSIEAEVTADLPGKEYNVGMTNFTIPGFRGAPKFAGFYAKSKTEIIGGATGKVKAVSADDLRKAEEELKNELKEKVGNLLAKQTPNGLRVLEQGEKEETVIVSSAKENEITDKFTLEATLTKEALLFKEEDIRKIAELNLTARLKDDQKPLSRTQQIEIAKPVIDWKEGKASFYIRVKEDVISAINETDLKKELLGKSEVEVRKILTNRPEIKKAKVSFRPFWVKRVPRQEKKIKITIY